VYAVEQVENSMPLQEMARQQTGKTVVVFGNEVSGVGDEALRLCDGSLEIPQWGMKHSLNISVAAGIVLWELARNYRFDKL
jgi:tRNA G18 (ribose-2'-O)-methylase SpoU